MEELKEEVKEEKPKKESVPDDRKGQYIRFPVKLYSRLLEKSKDLGISFTACVVLTLQNKLIESGQTEPGEQAEV